MSWRWSPPETDRWWRLDKLYHLGICFVLVLLLGLLDPWRAFVVILTLGWLWEVKDAYLRWENWGWIGAEGFSWKDGVVDTLGCAIGLAIHLLIAT